MKNDHDDGFEHFCANIQHLPAKDQLEATLNYMVRGLETKSVAEVRDMRDYLEITHAPGPILDLMLEVFDGHLALRKLRG